MPFFHPARLIATWFGTGLIPKAPGTCGSLVALPVAWLIQTSFGTGVLMLSIALLVPIGIWAAGKTADDMNEDDPGQIVVDEVVGQWLTVLFLPPIWWFYVIGFVVFRVFDIFKPWPVDHFDKHGAGGTGIMQDDLAAGLYGLFLLQAILATIEGLWPTII